MSGHSKWSTIKRKKARADAQKGKLFTRLSREIIVAARQGGGDPECNARLKTAVQKAREANIPNENIIRAIQKGVGGLGGSNYEEIVYEGYGPGGVAIMIEAMTDNRNRTAGEIRYIFSRNGGSLGETGCVSWLFSEKGLILIENTDNDIEEDDLMLLAIDSGAIDFRNEADSFEVITEPGDFQKVKEFLEEKGVKISFADVTMVPQNTVKIQGEEAELTMKLMDALEEHEDVQNVCANFEIEE